FDEVQARTAELSEALDQQTATSEVLRVISSSLGDLEPVFKAVLKNATRICGAQFGVLFRFDSGLFHLSASLDVPPAYRFLVAAGLICTPTRSIVWSPFTDKESDPSRSSERTRPQPLSQVRRCAIFNRCANAQKQRADRLFLYLSHRSTPIHR